jgi:hypothetical protein
VKALRPPDSPSGANTAPPATRLPTHPQLTNSHPRAIPQPRGAIINSAIPQNNTRQHRHQVGLIPMASNDFSASPVQGYCIYRDVPEGQLYDPTATLAFFPPKDSDELFDALRAKFPHLKSHSERMRDATIEFLLQERDAEALSANVSPAMPSLYDSMAETSPWQQSWPSVSMTTLSSPEMTNFATPAFGNSPKPQIPHLMRSQSSTATPSDAQTPALDSMTSVFSLSTTEQPKQRVRRKMTDLEKVEYRKRRIVKACDACSKRKRKVGLLYPFFKWRHANLCLVCSQQTGDGRPEEELQRQDNTQSH